MICKKKSNQPFSEGEKDLGQHTTSKMIWVPPVGAKCLEILYWLHVGGTKFDTSMIWYEMIWCDVMYDMIYDMIWYDMIWYDMIWYDMIYDMIWNGLVSAHGH